MAKLLLDITIQDSKISWPFVWAKNVVEKSTGSQLTADVIQLAESFSGANGGWIIPPFFDSSC